MNNLSVSIIIPAFNEEKHLKDAVEGLLVVLNKESLDWEILIINDCSSDKTGEIADSLTQKDERIKAVHNKKNRGLGYNFRKGTKLAKGEYVTWLPGDNENDPESLIDTIKKAGEKDIVIAYTSNMEVRAKNRRLLSNIYTKINNTLFGLNLNYYNGLSVYKRDLLMKTPKWGNSFAFAAEILVQLLKSGATYIEVPIKIKPTQKTSALKLKNFIGVGKAISSLFWKVKIRRQRIDL